MSRAPAIHPERTAIARSTASVPTREVERELSGKILDYGAGRGDDTAYLNHKGYDARAYDPYYFPKHPASGEKFDWVLFNYVLNVIPSRQDRDAALEDIHKLVAPGGHLLVSTRTEKDVEQQRRPGWKHYHDGWLTPHQTFQHGYTREELERQLAGHGFKVQKFLNEGTAVAVRAEDAGEGNLPSAIRAIPFGKKMPQAVYIHKSLEKKLPDPVKSAVEQAESFLPHHAKWNMIKIAVTGKSVSFLWYPDFDRNPHPALRYGYRVDAASGKVAEMDFRKTENPFILHRKETFVGEDYPGYAEFEKTTRKEEGAGLLSRPDIGTLDGWKKALSKAKLTSASSRAA